MRRFSPDPPFLKDVLEAAYRDFHSRYHRERDPVSLIHRYPNSRDKEVAAFLVALLSYGNVTTILSSAATVLNALGASPYEALLAGLPRGLLKGFRHRFTRGEDLEVVGAWLGQALRGAGSIENFFLATKIDSRMSMHEWLGDFLDRLTRLPLEPYLIRIKSRRRAGLKYLLSHPELGSACKRLNLFMRWMVRPADGIDLGLWRGITPEALILPVDTHVLKTLQILKWTSSKQASWKVAQQATERLKAYAPTDPVRYDFALCHLSMTGGQILDYFRNSPSEGITYAPMDR